MKKIILNPKQLERLYKSLSNFTSENAEFVVEKALNMEGEITPLECKDSGAISFELAREVYSKANIDTQEEKEGVRKMIEFSKKEEEIYVILDIISFDDDYDYEILLTIRKMAEIIISESEEK